MLVGQQASLAVHNARLYRAGEAGGGARGGELLPQAARAEEVRGDHRRLARDAHALRQAGSKVVDTRVSVLIEGETGTGKELVAERGALPVAPRTSSSSRRTARRCPRRCWRASSSGTRRARSPGATEDKKGLFELADGGTLFLDEIGEMPLGLQAKILRVLQEGEVRPLGRAVTVKNVDVRIVAATNRKLEDEVKAGRFRQDLYYRLQVFPVRIPALRERREDIPLLATPLPQALHARAGQARRGLLAAGDGAADVLRLARATCASSRTRCSAW
jgi:transcriptional regulator with GAF, ATPase, and Fis domain